MDNFTWPPTPNPFLEENDRAGEASLDSLASDGNIVSGDTVPAVMVAVASSIIICAMALYVTDLRDRCRHERRGNHQPDRRSKREIAGSNGRVIHSGGNYWITTSSAAQGRHYSCRDGAFPTLPPSETREAEDADCVEAISLSPVSTMTASYAPAEDRRLNRMDSDLYLAQSVDVTELSEINRVSGDTDLSSLVDLSRIQTFGSFATSALAAASLGTTTIANGSSRDQDGSSRRIRIDDTIYIASDDDDDTGWTSMDASSDSSSEVSIGTYLKSVHSRKSRSSSTGSNTTPSYPPEKRDPAEELYGEQYSREEEDSVDHSSLERSPDTPHKTTGGSDRNEFFHLKPLDDHKMDQIRTTNEPKLSLLEALLERGRAVMQGIDETSSLDEATEIDDSITQEYVRSIFFVPVCGTAGSAHALGIELEGTSSSTNHPSVKSIHGESPLRGRVFEGDVVLAVNNKDATGLGGKEVSRLATDGSKLSDVIKLTVISNKPDGSDTGSDTDQASIDTGIESTAIEV